MTGLWYTQVITCHNYVLMVFILRETGLLYYEGVSTESNRKSTALVIAHELAHMWFGNLVTLQWWDYTWLNEGFARLFQYLATDTVSPVTCHKTNYIAPSHSL
jgi:aminopeptidase N